MAQDHKRSQKCLFSNGVTIKSFCRLQCRSSHAFENARFIDFVLSVLQNRRKRVLRYPRRRNSPHA